MAGLARPKALIMPTMPAEQASIISPTDKILQTRYLRVQGRVQGVGYRPFVHALANELELKGWIRNARGQVDIACLGETGILKEFQTRLLSEAPLHARITALIEVDKPPPGTPSPAQLKGFSVLSSQRVDNEKHLTATIDLPPDRRVCKDCLRELFDPDNRRFLHPFVNCIACGPRLSVMHSLPYTRQNTSWSRFTMCQDCRSEYNNTAQTKDNRRFHSEGNNCHQCGPKLSWHTSADSLMQTPTQPVSGQHPPRAAKDVESHPIESDPIARAANEIDLGQLVAVKGLSGFHLLCDAGNREAIATSREVKHRPAKPFAVMCLNAASLNRIEPEYAALQLAISDPSAPIVLLPLSVTDSLDNQLQRAQLAPGLNQLGVMTPYTPLHYLLFYHLLGCPSGSEWLNAPCDRFLVVTSANAKGEPLISDYRQQQAQLSSLSDNVLDHTLYIEQPADDPVFLMTHAPKPQHIRLGRGTAPLSFNLGHKGPSVLAMGAYLKNTFCSTHQNTAYLSRHIGSLSSPANCRSLERSVASMLELQHLTPQAIACDLHPDIFSTTLAERISQSHTLPLFRVQHHRAHIASVLAECQIDSPVIGLALDGTGLGDDGQVWGGELFAGEGHALKRIGHFSPLLMPGGDRAAREIWRLGYSALARHEPELALQQIERFASEYLPHCRQFQSLKGSESSGSNAILLASTSAGRWFDSVASIIGLRQQCSYEGQAAMELQALAEDFGAPLPTAAHCVPILEDGQLDLYPLLPLLCQIKDRRLAAARFHAELIDALSRWTEGAAEEHGISDIVLSGGCFQNRLLVQGLVSLLEKKGLRVFVPEYVPCNDAGLALGQAWIARQLMIRGQQ